MKKTILLMFAMAFISLNTLAQKINWVTLEEAVGLQKKEKNKHTKGVLKKNTLTIILVSR